MECKRLDYLNKKKKSLGTNQVFKNKFEITYI